MTSVRTVRWLAIAALLVPACAWAGDRKYAGDFHHDFRGKPLPPELEIFNDPDGTFIKQEKEGLRVTLPKERDNYAPVGVKTLFPVRGDFEITFTAEILKAETPTNKFAFGVGASLYVKVEAATDKGATLGRLVRPGGKEIIVWDRTAEVKGKFTSDVVPCTEKIVRLRFVRNDAKWTYQWAPGTTGESFTDITPPFEFATEDLKVVALRCATGSEPRAVDVRFLELRVRSEGKLAEAPAINPDKPAVRPDAPRPADAAATGAGTSKLYLIVALGFGLGLTLLLVIAVGVWLLVRQRRPAAAATAEKRTKP